MCVCVLLSNAVSCCTSLLASFVCLCLYLCVCLSNYQSAARCMLHVACWMLNAACCIRRFECVNCWPPTPIVLPSFHFLLSHTHKTFITVLIYYFVSQLDEMCKNHQFTSHFSYCGQLKTILRQFQVSTDFSWLYERPKLNELLLRPQILNLVVERF